MSILGTRQQQIFRGVSILMNDTTSWRHHFAENIQRIALCLTHYIYINHIPMWFGDSLNCCHQKFALSGTRTYKIACADGNVASLERNSCFQFNDTIE